MVPESAGGRGLAERVGAGSPLDEYSLELKATKKIKEGAEWLLNFGPNCPPVRNARGDWLRKGKARAKKRARVSFGQAREIPQQAE